MSDNCLDSNIPEVDNSSLECEDIVSTNCIVAAEADTYMKYGVGATLTKILELISKSIKKLTNAQTTYLPTYKTFLVALDQAGTADPTPAIVIHNNLAITPALTRLGVGDYTLVATGAFPAEKTVITPAPTSAVFVAGSEISADEFYAVRVDNDTISIKTAQDTGSGGVLADDLLDGVNTIFEIRVYD